jgi:PilZ domain-containing protein
VSLIPVASYRPLKPYAGIELWLWPFVIFARAVDPATLPRMLFRNQYSPTRRSPRQWWNSSVEVFTASSHVKAIGMNISDGGMGLFAVANLAVGSEIELEFRVPETGIKTRLAGTIRHRALYLYGVEFLAQPEFCKDAASASAEV